MYILKIPIYSLIFFMVFGCKSQTENALAENTSLAENTDGYKIQPVNIQNIKLKDSFWLPTIERVQEKTIEYVLQKCKEKGRMDNFLLAGGKLAGDVKGEMPFDDTDVYKAIEGASNSLISSPNKKLEILLDSLIQIIEIGQEEDGYLTTWRTINPAKPPAKWVKVIEGKRWESLNMSHELYNAGHLYEAAAVHYRATGKKNFLNIALKNADLIVETFGDKEGQIKAVPGHQIIETGLIQLYQITGDEKYFEMAKYFLDNRGNPVNHELFGEYSQDHAPVTEQNEVVGHAVRAVYMYAAMTDIAAIENNSAYYDAVIDLWENMVNKKMYVTGGIGARHEGESFGVNYELPNLTAYNETCAAIGNVYWNHRLHNMTGDVKYFDIIERTLYNGLISGLSLDGTKFFYPNALESDGVYKFNQGSCTRADWFDCSCCPTNLVRFIPAIPGLIYSKSKDAIYVNLYASNDADIKLNEKIVTISQETSYPWNGKVNLKVKPQEEVDFTLKLRVPGWARNKVLPGDLYSYKEKNLKEISVFVNGEEVAFEQTDGYININRTWTKDEIIQLDFPMEVKKVETNSKVEENREKISLEYGPIVYALEEIDNKNINEAAVEEGNYFKVKKEEELLNGINIIHFNDFKAIPYYAWSNRGVGKMKVWLNYSPGVSRKQ